MKKIYSIALLLFILSILFSCYNDNLSELTPSSGVSGGSCDTTGVMSYSVNIAPILRSNCGSSNSCHNHNNTSGYDLSSYTGVYSVAVSGKLISSITWTGSATRMPENGSKMNSCNIIKIQKWVDAGALNN
ncbi:MAG TPA: hypothetical protein VIN08_08625 [Ohtaekwangia sp.]|uniref:hypothetical protein n=1 Tax=Ohtaekwangia sp. TaxID=2066019 RepID=UPI002F959808